MALSPANAAVSVTKSGALPLSRLLAQCLRQCVMPFRRDVIQQATFGSNAVRILPTTLQTLQEARKT
jgi:hypothetical protein